MAIPEVTIGSSWMYRYDLKQCQMAISEYTGGGIRLIRCGVTTLPTFPDTIDGNFYCYENSLSSLVGCPTIVKGFFACSSNQLKSLVGGPKIVLGSYSCENNPLESLEGAPDYIGGDFFCDQFTDADYRNYIGKKKALRESSDEANLGCILDIL